jgi:colanic acid/amylovoran biosynthesis glycosyltransferase
MTERAFADNTLLLLPSVTAKHTVDGRLIFTRKFLDGVCEYARLWQGPVLLAMETSETPNLGLDRIAVHSADLPFEIQPLPSAEAARRELISSAALVFAALVPRHVRMADLCAEENVPIAYDADNPLVVREAIIRVQTRNPLRRWRRRLWTRNLEAGYCSSIRRASGIQCNGTATFEAYRALTPLPLLYLNTRVRRDMQASEEERKARRARLLAGHPLHLVFSGRLVAMKGVLDLPRVAAALKQRGVAFMLDIFGSGDLESSLQRAVRTLQVTDCVRVRGELPFPDLVRRVARECDLFVCCHPQGDPSTTFLETMSCGVPLIGYDTEGLHDMVGCAGAGWLTPCGKPDELAERIAALDANRTALTDAAQVVYEFARTRTFEQTMRMRVEHLQSCAARVPIDSS